MYGKNSSCAAGEVEIDVKEFDNLRPPRLPCPVCGRALKALTVTSHSEG